MRLVLTRYVLRRVQPFRHFHKCPFLGSITFERTTLVVQAAGKDLIRWQEVHTPHEIARNPNGMVDIASGRITVVHFIL